MPTTAEQLGRMFRDLSNHYATVIENLLKEVDFDTLYDEAKELAEGVDLDMSTLGDEWDRTIHNKKHYCSLSEKLEALENVAAGRVSMYNMVLEHSQLSPTETANLKQRRNAAAAARDNIKRLKEIVKALCILKTFEKAMSDNAEVYGY